MSKDKTKVTVTTEMQMSKRCVLSGASRPAETEEQPVEEWTGNSSHGFLGNAVNINISNNNSRGEKAISLCCRLQVPEVSYEEVPEEAQRAGLAQSHCLQQGQIVSPFHSCRLFNAQHHRSSTAWFMVFLFFEANGTRPRPSVSFVLMTWDITAHLHQGGCYRGIENVNWCHIPELCSLAQHEAGMAQAGKYIRRQARGVNGVHVSCS